MLINGSEADIPVRENGYIFIRDDFSSQTVIDMELEMKPKLMASNRNIHYNAQKAAIVRGPLVYCIEEADNGKYLSELSILADSPLEEKVMDQFGGAVMIQGKGVRKVNKTDAGELYTPYAAEEYKTDIRAVPYFLWNNREAGEMQVWIRTQ